MRQFFLVAGIVFLVGISGCGNEKNADWEDLTTDTLIGDSGSLERPFTINEENRRFALSGNFPTQLTKEILVPFTSLVFQNEPVKFYLNTATVQVRLLLKNGKNLHFSRPGIPVKLIELEDGALWVIFRSFPDNKLKIAVFLPGKSEPDYHQIGEQDDGYLFYRAALAVVSDIYLVLYDNRSRENTLYLHAHGSLIPTSQKVLPSLEDPAGGNYEMEPPIFLVQSKEDALYVLGGTLDGLFSDGKLSVKRRPECVRIIEAVSTPDGVATLCDLKPNNSRDIFRISASDGSRWDFKAADNIPWRLRWDKKNQQLTWSVASSAKERGALLEFDLQRGQNSGLLELGSNNVEGRIAWSQIYYLNGFFDLLLLARSDDQAFQAFGHLVEPIRRRLDLELSLLDKVLSTPLYYQSHPFTVKRQPALFAVQTSRLLGILQRHAHELPGASPAQNLKRVRGDVFNLRGHIEVLADSGEDERWIPEGRYHLRWPRGCAFPFDGLNVPFNHQNEWAWSLFEAALQEPELRSHRSLAAAKDIILTFNDLVLSLDGGAFPADAQWNYWWGRAYDGWTEEEDVSVNIPSYDGDHILAWTSFRTIDVMSVLSGLGKVPELNQKAVLDSTAKLVFQGGIYPFAAGSLIRHNRYPLLSPETASRFIRVGPPSEIASAVWAVARSH